MNNRRYTMTLAATCTTVLIATSMLARGGPLTPPPGPVAPTMLTLDMIEPRTPIGPDTTPGDAANLYRITQPGSYILTANLTGEANKTGIRIDASHVRLDLNGFTLQGVPDSREGIRIGGNHVTVRNGSVVDWGRQGVRAFSELSQRNAVVEDIAAIDNGGDGIDIYESGVVRRCTAAGNDGIGIHVYSDSLIESCIVRNNTGDGINTNFACIVRDCTTLYNAGHGIRIGGQSQAIECVARSNTEHGFMGLDSCTFTSCSADQNIGNGFETGDRAVFDGCEAGGNGADGIRSGSGTVMTLCTAADNGANGIWTGFASAVSVVSARINEEYGVYSNTGGSLSFVAANGNERGVSATQVFGSVASANDLAGFTVYGLASQCVARYSDYGFIVSQHSRVHECSAASHHYAFNANTFDPVMMSANTAFDSLHASYDDTFTGQDTETPVGAGAWQNFADELP